MADFEAALANSRASVTPEMEREYEQIAARLKQDATALQPIGFVFPRAAWPITRRRSARDLAALPRP